MPATTYTGNNIINSILRSSQFPLPERTYISLHTDNPSLTGSNEITNAVWPAYKRLDASQGGDANTGFTQATAMSTQNTKQLLWPAHNGTQPINITHIAIWDSLSGGNCLWTSTLNAAKQLAPTDELVFHAATMTLSVE